MAESKKELISRIVIEPIKQLQADLVEVEYRREDGDLFLRIFIDRETGVTLDLHHRPGA